MAQWTRHIHYSCILQYLYWPLSRTFGQVFILTKLVQSRPPNWTYAKCRGGVRCWIMRLFEGTLQRERNACVAEPNDTCLLLVRPETDTAVTSDLLTFECHCAGLHFSSLEWIQLLQNLVAVIKTPGCTWLCGRFVLIVDPDDHSFCWYCEEGGWLVALMASCVAVPHVEDQHWGFNI